MLSGQPSGATCYLGQAAAGKSERHHEPAGHHSVITVRRYLRSGTATCSGKTQPTGSVFDQEQPSVYRLLAPCSIVRMRTVFRVILYVTTC